MRTFFIKTGLLICALCACYNTFSQTKAGSTAGLHLIKGNTYLLVLSNTKTQKQNIDQQPLSMGIYIKAKLSFTVTGIADSIYNMQARYDSLGMTMDMPTGQASFNSEAKEAVFISEILSKLREKTFNVILSRTGRVITVDGIDTLISATANSFSAKAPADQIQQARQQLTEIFGNAALRDNLEAVTNIHPPVAMAKNAKWTIDRKTQSVPNITEHAIYFINALTANTKVIEANGLVNILSKPGSAGVNYNLTGNITKLITVNAQTGWPIEALVKLEMKGNATVTYSEKLPGGMVIPTQLSNIITVTKK